MSIFRRPTQSETNLTDELVSAQIDAYLSDNGDLIEQDQSDLKQSNQEGLYDPMRKDYDAMRNQFAAHEPELDQALRNLSQGHLIEEATTMFSNSKFAKAYQADIEIGAMQQCRLAEYGLSGCVDNVQVGCGIRTLTDTSRIGDWAQEAKKLEATQWMGLGDANCITFPKPGKRKLGFAYCREDLCNMMFDASVRLMRSAGEAMDIRRERMLADIFGNFFALDPNNGPNEYDTIPVIPFLFNHAPYNAYQPYMGSGPWGNTVVGDPYNDDAAIRAAYPCPKTCNMDMGCWIDEWEDNRGDLSNHCLPVNCEGGDLQLLSGSNKGANRLAPMLGAKTIRLDTVTEDGCTGSFEFERTGRQMEMKSSKWFEQRLLYWIKMACPELSAAEARKYADCFWAVGRFRQFLTWMIEWDRQELSMGGGDIDTPIWGNMNQEIICYFKVLEKSGPGILDPTQVLIHKALPFKA